MKKLLLSGAILFSAAHLSAQCSMYPVLLSQRLPQSGLVIEGKVINQTCFWDAEHNRIYTSNLIEVYKAFKNTSAPYIEVITKGGTVGNKMHLVEPTLQLNIGDLGVFTLNPNTQPAQFGKPVYEAYADAQGFIKYDVVHNTATEPFNRYTNISTSLYHTIEQLTAINHVQVKPVNPFQLAVANTGNTTQAVAAITNFSPATISAGTFSVLTINGSNFGTTITPSWIKFKNANAGNSTVSPDSSQIVSWTATQIRVMVPMRAGTGLIEVNGALSATSLTVTYSHFNGVLSGNVYNTKHIDLASGGYLWTYNTTFFANAAAKASFERSLNTWRCGTLINWGIDPGTSAISAAASDGVNIVTYNSGMGTGVLGQCRSYFSSCGSGPTWFVDELDIEFDPTPGTSTWQYGPANPGTSQYDFESVSAHELGHGHQLGHVINSADLMHSSIGTGQLKRTLNANNLNGASAVMNRSTSSGACGFSAMIPLVAGSCSLGSLGAAFTTSTQACTNRAITLMDASAGSPTSWSWSMPGGSPATASSQNTPVTYATSGIKTISLTVTNGTATSTTSQTLNVTATPTLVVTPTSTTICTGQLVVLRATGASAYIWSPGGGSGANNPVSPTVNTSYTVTGSVNSCNSTPYSLAVNVSTCTGLEDLETHNHISLYPNPCNGIFTISSINNTGKLDIAVINMLGQTVKTESSNDPKELVLDMSTYGKGVYYVKVQMNDGARLVKIVLN